MPLDQPHAPAVPMQLQKSLRHVPLQPALRDLPDPHLQRGRRASAGWAGPGEAPAALFLRHQAFGDLPGKVSPGQGGGQSPTEAWGGGCRVWLERKETISSVPLGGFSPISLCRRW